jgi:predicted glycosyltransferase
MGGYNTVCEILALQKKAVLVPRVEPRLEQWIRCSRLDEMGLARTLHPSVATPQALWQAIDAALAGECCRQREAVGFDGLNFVVGLVRKVFAEPAASVAAALAERFSLEDWAPEALAS